MTPTAFDDTRHLTPDEIGRVVRAFRDEFGWSQETLAELAGVTSRTVQRLEAGEPSSLDTRRAVARAFRFEDVDWLNKPFPFPDAAALQARREAFEREHLVLDARVVDGRALMAMLVDAGCDCLAGSGLSELPEGAREAFATAMDFIRDCLDVREVVPMGEMLGYGDELQAILEPLRAAGHAISAATRRTSITQAGWSAPLPVSILYVAAAPAGEPTTKIAVPRKFAVAA